MFWPGCPSDASAWSCTTAGLCNIREQAFSTILSITSLFPLLFIHNHCLLLRVRSADNGLPKTSLLRHHCAEETWITAEIRGTACPCVRLRSWVDSICLSNQFLLLGKQLGMKWVANTYKSTYTHTHLIFLHTCKMHYMLLALQVLCQKWSSLNPLAISSPLKNRFFPKIYSYAFLISQLLCYWWLSWWCWFESPLAVQV